MDPRTNLRQQHCRVFWPLEQSGWPIPLFPLLTILSLINWVRNSGASTFKNSSNMHFQENNKTSGLVSISWIVIQGWGGGHSGSWLLVGIEEFNNLCSYCAVGYQNLLVWQLFIRFGRSVVQLQPFLNRCSLLKTLMPQIKKINPHICVSWANCQNHTKMWAVTYRQRRQLGPCKGRS